MNIVLTAAEDPSFFQKLAEDFYLNFVKDARWEYIVDGLRVTLTVTFFAVIIGIVLGFLVAIIRSTHDKATNLSPFLKAVLAVLNFFCNVYLTVIEELPYWYSF